MLSDNFGSKVYTVEVAIRGNFVIKRLSQGVNLGEFVFPRCRIFESRNKFECYREVLSENFGSKVYTVEVAIRGNFVIKGLSLGVNLGEFVFPRC